jgi:putative transposase
MRSIGFHAGVVKLLDEGEYLGSPATIARIFKKKKISRRAVETIRRKRPELCATEKNQIWCWDITYLPARTKGRYFYLYLVIDLFSRKIVGYSVETHEDGVLASRMMADTIAAENPDPTKLVIHSDNGAPMRSKSLQHICERLGIQQSFSRPHTSNDNAFSESIFSTVKSRHSYPEAFSCIEAAEIWVFEFTKWYNEKHLHSSIGYLTPNSLHNGEGQAIQDKRNKALEEVRLKTSSRFGTRKRKFTVQTEARLKHMTTLTLSTDTKKPNAPLKIAGKCDVSEFANPKNSADPITPEQNIAVEIEHTANDKDGVGPHRQAEEIQELNGHPGVPDRGSKSHPKGWRKSTRNRR